MKHEKGFWKFTYCIAPNDEWSMFMTKEELLSRCTNHCEGLVNSVIGWAVALDILLAKEEAREKFNKAYGPDRDDWSKITEEGWSVIPSGGSKPIYIYSMKVEHGGTTYVASTEALSFLEKHTVHHADQEKE